MNPPMSHENLTPPLNNAGTAMSVHSVPSKAPRHWIPDLPLRPHPDFVPDDDRVTGRMSNE